MIRLLRVDHRLLHGQVAFSWTNTLQADCILIANDEVVTDELRMTTLKLAKPAGVKLVIKSIKDSVEALNSGVTDKYKLFIVVESVADAARLADGVKDIRSINIGGTKQKEGTERLAKTLNVTGEDRETLKALIAKGIEVEVRQVPTDSKLNVAELL